MTPNVMAWFQKIVALYPPEGPCLEVGSMNVNGSVRDMFPEPYTGLDMRPGAGVDEVAEFLYWTQYGYRSIVSTETLEHTLEPWSIVEKMSECLDDGGRVYLSVPWMFVMHDYPEDCWRILPRAMNHILERAGLTPLLIENDESHTFAVAEKAA